MNRIWIALLLSCFFVVSVARADDPATTNKTTKQAKQPSADNTVANKENRDPNADQQKNDKSDLDMTVAIRRAIIKDRSLSVDAHNVKIIAQNGTVTLRGPVRSAEEKSTVDKKASSVAGPTNVKSEIEIKP